jgi:metallopeptidase MepB
MYTLIRHFSPDWVFYWRWNTEVGHSIHDLLFKTRYVRFHGTRLPKDFVKIPSVMLENWWMRDVLKELSCHYMTLDVNHLRKWRSDHAGVPDSPKEFPVDLIDCLIGRH